MYHPPLFLKTASSGKHFPGFLKAFPVHILWPSSLLTFLVWETSGLSQGRREQQLAWRRLPGTKKDPEAACGLPDARGSTLSLKCTHLKQQQTAQEK